jgi:hypothetical protein
MLWNWRMFLATGEARYIDVVELALYNAVLSGVSLEGTDYFYTNPLRQVEPLPTKLRWSRTRVPFVTSYCCPPNVLRTIAEVNGYAYSKTEDAVWVNLYGGSTLSTTLSGKPLKLTQQTNYPWEGDIRVTFQECPDARFALKLRIPGWADGATIRVNGEGVRHLFVGGASEATERVRDKKVPDPFAAPATYAEIRRRWQPGDVVDLILPMPARLIEANPLVEETRNQVAIQRGPMVYCLESPDLPDGVRMPDVVVPADAKLTVRIDRDLLQGVAVIEADVLARPSGDWSGTLYRPLGRKRETTFRARFIPYYAWSNRGPSEMTVWLPLK